MDYLNELKDILKKVYGLDYHSDKTDNEYHKKGYEFFNEPETKENIDAAIELLSKKNENFILIDIENIYFHYTASPTDKRLLAGILKPYLKKYNIVLFCQKHSLENANEKVKTDGRIKNLVDHLPRRLAKKVYIFSGDKQYEKTLLGKVLNFGKKLKRFQEVQIILKEVPNQSEVDDILLVYVAKQLIEKEKQNIFIVSRDKFRWLAGNPTLMNAITKIRKDSIGDQDISLDIPNNNTRKRHKAPSDRLRRDRNPPPTTRKRHRDSSGSSSGSSYGSSYGSSSGSRSGSSSGSTKKRKKKSRMGRSPHKR